MQLSWLMNTLTHEGLLGNKYGAEQGEFINFFQNKSSSPENGSRIIFLGWSKLLPTQEASK